MSEQEYLRKLTGYLTGRISRWELESILEYYKEYFRETGAEAAWRAEEELGTPDEAAARILGAGFRPTRWGRRKPRRWSRGQLVAVIVLSPIWAPVLLALAAAVVGLALCLLGAAVSVAAGGVACVGGGLFSMWCGFTQVFYSIPTMTFFCGLGLIAVAMGLLIFLGGAVLCQLWCKGIAALARRLFRRMGEERAA